jgi:hypothetical protein
MNTTDWLLLAVGVLIGHWITKHAGMAASGLQQAGSAVNLSAGDKLNPGSAAQNTPADAVSSGINLLGNLNAAPGGTDPYATIFSNALPSAG